MEDKKVTFETIINECIEIYKKKHYDYGNSATQT